jgi:hypothetical protein
MTFPPRYPQERQVNPHRQERRIFSTPLTNPLGEMAEQYSIAPRSQVEYLVALHEPMVSSGVTLRGPFS